MNRLDDDNDNLLDRATRAMASAADRGDFPQHEILRSVQAAISPAASSPRQSYRFFHRIRSLNPLFKVAASLLIAASTLAVVWAFFHAGPVLAFSSIAQQLHDAQTLTADLSIKQNSIAMNGKLLFAAPGHFRVEFPGTPPEVVDMQTGRIVLIDHARKNAVVMHISDKDASVAAPAAASLDWFEQLRNISHSAGKPVGEADINGIHAQQFNVSQEGQEFTIWADARTGAPLRVQSEVKFGEDQIKVTLDHLALGQPIDNGLFSTAVPAGYAQQQGTVSADTPVESDLVGFFKDYSSRTGVLPPSLNDFDKTLGPISHNADSRPAGAAPLPPVDFMKLMIEAGRIMMFLKQLPPSADWHYAGADVKPAASDGAIKPIFWYHPNSSATWRIIYADLHTADAAAGSAPHIPAETQPSTTGN
jgi:outer membrane lipoprotein-sorting protein